MQISPVMKQCLDAGAIAMMFINYPDFARANYDFLMSALDKIEQSAKVDDMTKEDILEYLKQSYPQELH